MRNALLLLLALLAPLSAQPDRFGLPACAGPDRELAPKHFFIVCHSASFMAPLWAAHELTPSRLLSPVSTRRARFRRDYSLSMPGASVAGYRSTGFSRGHLVPARDVAHDEEALRDSFLVRKLAAEVYSVIVVTGAIFAEIPERIGLGGIAVPAQLYKVILVCKGSRTSLIAVMMPNADVSGRSLESFIVPVAEVERRTALEFFPVLPWTAIDVDDRVGG